MGMVLISNRARCLAVAGLIWLGLGSTVRGGQQSPAGQQVTLGWTASADPTVVGYYFYYGTQPGVYPHKIDVGANTTFTLTGLAAGSNYFFTTTSYTAARVESSYVAEVSYIVPGILTVTQNLSSATTRVQFPVAASHSYQLQSSPDMTAWSTVWLTPTQTTNAWIEYDEPLSRTIQSKFYRLILN
jgi:hypothetical protein